MTAPPGWYPNPNQPHDNTVHYWDGTRWTGDARPAAQQSPTPQEQHVQTPIASSSMLGFGKKKALEAENAHLKDMLARLGGADLLGLEQYRAALQADVARMQAEAEHLHAQIAAARANLIDAQDQDTLQSFGLFNFDNPAQDSVTLGRELDQVRVQIKAMVRDKAAILATNNFTFNNSAAKGRQFVNNMSKIMLRAYNAEAENAVKTVKAGWRVPCRSVRPVLES